MNRLEWLFVLLFLIGTVVLASFGIDHAGESMVIAIISPILLVAAVTLGVAITLAKFTRRG